MRCRSRLSQTIPMGATLFLFLMLCSVILMHLTLDMRTQQQQTHTLMATGATSGGMSMTSGMQSDESSLTDSIQKGWNRIRKLAKKRSKRLLDQIMSNSVGGGVDPLPSSEASSASSSGRALMRGPKGGVRSMRGDLATIIPIEFTEPETIVHQVDDTATSLVQQQLPSVDSVIHQAIARSRGIEALALTPPHPSSLTALTLPPFTAPGSATDRIVVGARFWAQSESDIDRLRSFILRTSSLVRKVLVAVNVEADRMQTLTIVQSWNLPVERVQFIPVMPWGGVSTALNILAHTAAQQGFESIMYQSPEVVLTESQMELLLHAWQTQPRALVIGPVLDGHEFLETREDEQLQPISSAEPGSESNLGSSSGRRRRGHLRGHAINGRNAPWNTAAIWHLPSLLKTGFLMVADGTPKGLYEYGQEEVPTMTMLQSMAMQHRRRLRHARRRAHGNEGGSTASATNLHTSMELTPSLPDNQRYAIHLVHAGDVTWDHSFPDASARREWHQQKMNSKMSRASHHLHVLGDIQPGRVVHTIARIHREEGRVEAQTIAGSSDGHVLGHQSIPGVESRPIPTGTEHAASAVAPASTSSLPSQQTASSPASVPPTAAASTPSAAPSLSSTPSVSFMSPYPVPTPATPPPTPSTSPPPSPRPISKLSQFTSHMRDPHSESIMHGRDAGVAMDGNRNVDMEPLPPHQQHMDEPKLDVKIRQHIPIGRRLLRYLTKEEVEMGTNAPPDAMMSA